MSRVQSARVQSARAPSVRALGLAAGLVLVAAGCSSGGAPSISVTVTDQQIDVAASQYCLDDEGYRNTSAPPILEVGPELSILIEVPEEVAETGWGIQVRDDQLDELIGEVDVGNRASYALNTSDAVPAAYYLVVVQDRGEECDGYSGAWPVGFIRSATTLPGPSGSDLPTPTGSVDPIPPPRPPSGPPPVPVPTDQTTEG